MGEITFKLTYYRMEFSYPANAVDVYECDRQTLKLYSFDEQNSLSLYFAFILNQVHLKSEKVSVNISK